MLPWRRRIAAALAASGHPLRARRLAYLDLHAARRWGAPRTVAAALVVAGTFEEGDAQLELLEEALPNCTMPEHVLPRIEALSALGASLRRRGQRARAREYLTEAQHLAQQTGALAALRGAREELLSAGGRPRRLAARGVDALTPAELRVARLAAEGRSNPEIAQLLFVTRRTVETHLTSIYGKLGVANRRQLSDALS